MAAKRVAKRTAKRTARNVKAARTAGKKVAARGGTAARGRKRQGARRPPERLHLRSVGPSFTVADLGRSLAYYRDVLGFTPREEWRDSGVLKGIELVAGRVSFWLSQDDWKKGRDRVKGQGFRLYCSTAQDVDALAARVRAAGGTIVEEPKDEPWGGRDFAVCDPDGFVISFAGGA